MPYSPFIDRLLRDPELFNKLIATETLHHTERDSVRKSDDQTIAGDRAILRAPAFALVRGGLLYALDAIHEAHVYFQEASGDLGAYWHGMMHRREGDFDNARYWFRRAGTQPFFAVAHSASAAHSADMARQASWDAYLFTGQFLLSAAWQQDSRAPDSERLDPENKLFARMPRRRLEIEPWRDAMLTASGLLDPKLGGPSKPLSSDKNLRRTLYGTVVRDELDPMLRINDFPEASAHSPARQETSTPLQMLFALNSSFLQQQADALACRTAEAGGTEERVRRAYALTYQRAPTEKELKLAQRFFAGREQDAKAWAEYAQALLASNEMLFLD